MRSLQLNMVLLCFLTCISSQAQTIPDSEFQWLVKTSCSPHRTCMEIFAKVEVDPILTLHNKQGFDDLIRKTIRKIALSKDQTGTIKLKLLFLKGQNLCVSEIGTYKLKLNEDQLEEIKETLNSISEFNYGKQRNMEVNCQGILYINIDKGNVHEIRNVNFKNAYK